MVNVELRRRTTNTDGSLIVGGTVRQLNCSQTSRKVLEFENDFERNS